MNGKLIRTHNNKHNTANDARRFNFFLKGNAIIKVEETFAAVTDLIHHLVVVT